MLALIVAHALTPIAYALPMDKPALYDVKVAFDGFIPILGGQQGQVQVNLGVSAEAIEKDKDGNPQATTDLKAIKVVFNGAVLPLDISNAKTYFPKTTISMTPQGRILKTDAPNLSLPIRLPGLDIKRMPDITFLPVEFPVDGVEPGKEWTFKKSFGDSDVTFNVKATTVTDSVVDMDVDLRQSYDTLEDPSLAIPADPKDAVSKVHTEVVGQGKVVFDRRLGLVESATIDADAKSKVVAIQGGKTHDRELKTQLEIHRASGGTMQAINDRPADKLGKLKEKAALYWQIAKIKADPTLATVKDFIARQVAYLQRLAEGN